MAASGGNFSWAGNSKRVTADAAGVTLPHPLSNLNLLDPSALSQLDDDVLTQEIKRRKLLAKEAASKKGDVNTLHSVQEAAQAAPPVRRGGRQSKRGGAGRGRASSSNGKTPAGATSAAPDSAGEPSPADTGVAVSPTLALASEDLNNAAGGVACSAPEAAPLAGGVGCSAREAAPLAGGVGCSAREAAPLAGGGGCSAREAAPLAGGVGCSAREAAPLAGGVGCSAREAAPLAGGVVCTVMEAAEEGGAIPFGNFGIEACSDDDKLNDDDADDAVGAQAGTNAELREAEVRAAELCALEMRAAELRAAELCASEVRAAEARAAELRSAELRAAEVRQTDKATPTSHQNETAAPARRERSQVAGAHHFREARQLEAQLRDLQNTVSVLQAQLQEARTKIKTPHLVRKYIAEGTTQDEYYLFMGGNSKRIERALKVIGCKRANMNKPIKLWAWGAGGVIDKEKWFLLKVGGIIPTQARDEEWVEKFKHPKYGYDWHCSAQGRPFANAGFELAVKKAFVSARCNMFAVKIPAVGYLCNVVEWPLENHKGKKGYASLDNNETNNRNNVHAKTRVVAAWLKKTLDREPATFKIDEPMGFEMGVGKVRILIEGYELFFFPSGVVPTPWPPVNNLLRGGQCGLWGGGQVYEKGQQGRVCVPWGSSLRRHCQAVAWRVGAPGAWVQESGGSWGVGAGEWGLLGRGCRRVEPPGAWVRESGGSWGVGARALPPPPSCATIVCPTNSTCNATADPPCTCDEGFEMINGQCVGEFPPSRLLPSLLPSLPLLALSLLTVFLLSISLLSCFLLSLFYLSLFLLSFHLAFFLLSISLLILLFSHFLLSYFLLSLFLPSLYVLPLFFSRSCFCPCFFSPSSFPLASHFLSSHPLPSHSCFSPSSLSPSLSTAFTCSLPDQTQIQGTPLISAAPWNRTPSLPSFLHTPAPPRVVSALSFRRQPALPPPRPRHLPPTVAAAGGERQGRGWCSAGGVLCWRGSLLAGFSAGKVLCWRGSLLAGFSAGGVLCWRGSLLAGFSAGGVLCWRGSLLAGCSAGVWCWCLVLASGAGAWCWRLALVLVSGARS
ncbi:unnamed protein product [Closterium sp. Naga37s-1]|nr:unnamed protein product [Closterium sp. Naga37s-1]